MTSDDPLPTALEQPTDTRLPPRDELPVPLIGPGDFVRLKQPTTISELGMSDRLKQTLKRQAATYFVTHRDELLDQMPEHTATMFTDLSVDELIELPYNTLSDVEGLKPLFSVTHGIVAQIVSRYPATELTTDTATIRKFTSERSGDPVRNVSLFPFGPCSHLRTIGHPTESIAPCFVDEHVASLVLVHKSGDAWGNEYQIDLADAYTEYLGIDEPQHFDPTAE